MKYIFKFSNIFCNNLREMSLSALKFVFKKAGIRSTPYAPLLSEFVYSGNSHYSSLKTAREAELNGISLSTTTAYDYLSVNATCLSSSIPKALEIFSQIHKIEVSDYKLKEISSRYLQHLNYLKSDPASVINSAIHQLAFHQQSLGNDHLFVNMPNLQQMQEISQSLLSGVLLSVSEDTVSTESLKMDQSPIKHVKHQFVGGSTNIPFQCPNSVTIAFPIPNAPDAIELKRVLGSSTPLVQYGQSTSLLGQIKNAKIATQLHLHENAPSLLQFTIHSNDFKSAYTGILNALQQVSTNLPNPIPKTLNSQLNTQLFKLLNIAQENGDAKRASQHVLKHLHHHAVVYCGKVNDIPRFETK
eukprot:NODE_353_length_8928_cov_0.455204.p2 type:complete len:358 gc:universal NODE_353_length_8928_cov_0.455204:1640-567(-)